MTGWLALLLLAALAAGSPPHALRQGGGSQFLAEIADQHGFTLPPRQLTAPTNEEQEPQQQVLGARDFPFGMANPQSPARASRAGKHRLNKVKRDIYDSTRLPTSLVPTRYKVTVAPNLEKGIFYVTTDIYFNVREATSRIILHAAELQYSTKDNVIQLKLLKYNRDTENYEDVESPKDVTVDKDSGRLVIGLTKELEVGEHYLLSFPLMGAYLRSDLKGFYISTYTDALGNEVRIGTTQFEPPAARFAFPCFDEPEYKARFQITIEHDRALYAVSNMKVLRRSSPALPIVRTEFEETPPMSTYLLAWVVSDFSQVVNEGQTFNTWGRSNLLNAASSYLSQSIGPKALEHLKDFTGIPYALPKVDQFAIPDFEAGAMENWGLVTYREEYLLETEDTNIRIREFIATTVCHELGHQWTGNLVTLDWWSNTWLNEGFATYFENVICAELIPEWKLMDKYVTDNVHVGIANDVLEGQVAMSSPVFTDSAIENKFDRISYKKGGSVLRMFEHILGTDVFKKSLKRYLTANAYKNGSPERLFRAMDAEVASLADANKNPLPEGVKFAEVAKSWTEQAGVPVITAIRNEQNQLTISQEQFLYDERKPQDGEEATLWYVPVPLEVTPKTKDPAAWDMLSAANNKRWLTPAEPSITRDLEAAPSEWYLLNPGQIGYYIVNYDEDNWQKLIKALTAKPSDFPASTRTQLIHDALALARAGKLKYEIAMPILMALKGEREAAPWRAAIAGLAFFRDRLTTTPAGVALKALVKEMTADAFKDLSFQVPVTPLGDFSKDEERYLRYYLASYACSAGNPQCATAAVEELNQAYDKYKMPHADIRDTARCFGVQNSADLFEKVKTDWEEAETLAESTEMAASLACTLDHKKLANLLDSILDNKTTKTPWKLTALIDAIAARWENHHFLVDYYKKNYKKIFSFTGSTYHYYLLFALIGDMRTDAEFEDMKAFVETAFPDTASTVRMEIDLRMAAVEKDLAWYRTHYPTVSKWLFAETGTGPDVSTTARPPTVQPTTEPPTQPPTRATSTTPKPSSATPVAASAALILAAIITVMGRH